MASASKCKECEEYIAVTHGSDPTLATQAVVDDNPLDQSSAMRRGCGRTLQATARHDRSGRDPPASPVCCIDPG